MFFPHNTFRQDIILHAPMVTATASALVGLNFSIKGARHGINRTTTININQHNQTSNNNPAIIKSNCFNFNSNDDDDNAESTSEGRHLGIPTNWHTISGQPCESARPAGLFHILIIIPLLTIANHAFPLNYRTCTSPCGTRTANQFMDMRGTTVALCKHHSPTIRRS
jgi:hypothetical protein